MRDSSSTDRPHDRPPSGEPSSSRNPLGNVAAEDLDAITAYLDGELSPDAARQIETRLATDEAFRATLQAYQQSWDLLDDLPRTDPDQRFAASTVEMVALDVARESNPSLTVGAITMARQWAVVGLSVLAACLIGFLVMTVGQAGLHAVGLVTDSNEQLLDELPVLVHLEKYQVVEDLDFLRAYRQLPNSSVDAWYRPTLFDPHLAAEQPRSERIELITAMPTEKKRSLATSAERFHALKPEQQQQIRAFHGALTTDPEAEALTIALDRYYEWYKHLPPEQRIELRFASTEDRLARIAQLRSEQEKELERQRIVGDMRTVVRWIEGRAIKYRKELLAEIPARRREQIERLPKPDQKRVLAHLLWQRWRTTKGLKDPTVSPKEIHTLVKNLSPETRAALDRSGDHDVLFESITQQLAQKSRRKSHQDRDRRPDASPDDAFQAFFRPARPKDPPGPDDAQLRRIYREDLTESEQTEWNRLPREQMMAKLRERYYERHKRRPPPPRWHGGPPPGSGRYGPGRHRRPDRQGSGRQGSDERGHAGPSRHPRPPHDEPRD